MKIEKRIVDVKRHTKAYVVDGRRMPRGAVVKQARRGKISNARAVAGAGRWYVMSGNDSSGGLYELPVIVER